MKVYSIFSKIAAEPPRRVDVATSKSQGKSAPGRIKLLRDSKYVRGYGAPLKPFRETHVEEDVRSCLRPPSESRSRKSETPEKRSTTENKHVRGTKAPGRAFRLIEPLRTRGKGAFVPFHFFPNRFSFSGVSISPAR